VQFIRKYLSSAWQALFGDPVRAFGVVSLILLLVLAIAPANEHFSQWHSYQRKYLGLIHDRGDAISLRRRFEPRRRPSTWHGFPTRSNASSRATQSLTG